MPKPKNIVIKEQPDQKAGPDSKEPEPVKHNDIVRFTAEDGATGVNITFSGETPFQGNVVGYNTDLVVVAEHKRGGKNVYKYNCTMMKGARKLDSTGGGEIEIVSSDG